ncbi:MAG TPA: response regulator [Rhodocyclaceae bacterium]
MPPTPPDGPADAADRLEKAEAALLALKNREADAVLDKDGVSYIRAKEVIDRERQAADTLRESEERYRLLFECMTEGFCTLEMIFGAEDRPVDGRCLEANPAFERQMGLQAAAGKSMRQWLPDLEAYWLDALGRVVLTGEPARFEYEVTSVHRWVEVVAYRVGPAELRRVAILIDDITVRKRMERQVAEDLQALTSLQRLATKFVSATNIEPLLGEIVETAIAIAGADCGNLQLLDPATGDLRIAAQRGFPQWWLDYWDNVTKGHGSCGTALERGARIVVEDVEHSPIFAGTPALDVQLRAGVRAVQSTPLLSHSGTPLGMFSTHYKRPHYLDRHAGDLLDVLARLTADAIERHATMQRLQEAKTAAESANAAKSAFLANMSHEIRTPMNAILGMAYLIRKQGVTPKQEYHLRRLDESANHLLQIIDDILDISKIEAGKLVLESIDFSLDAMIGKVASIVGAKAAEKGLVLTIDSPPLPCHVVGDITRLTQALLNYANNAVKFTHQGGIVLRSRVQEETSERLLLRFEVEDSGIGIPAEQFAGLFSSFVQADASTTREYGGSGLGLAITKRLAQLMGGDAGASSTPDLGSVFWFTAWLGKAAAAGMPTGMAAARDGVSMARCRGRKVLLAEDDVDNRSLTMELLSDLGLLVETASTGAEAVEKAGANAYDLILMDVQMPVMDGLEATRRIRRIEGREKLPIIALTANVFSEDRVRCLAAGMDDFLSKPVLPHDLGASIIKWLAA